MAAYDLFGQNFVAPNTFNSNIDSSKKLSSVFNEAFSPPAILNSNVDSSKKLFSVFTQPLASAPASTTYRMRGYLTPSGPYVQWNETNEPGIGNAPGPVTDVAVLSKTC